MNTPLHSVRTEPTEGQPPPVYLVDNHANLHIQSGEVRLVLTPASALELIKFLERTQFQQTAKGGAAL